MDKFTEAYIECAIWASTVDDPRYPPGADNPGGEPMDAHYSADDLAPETLATMMADCADFQESFGERIASNLERAGHDFWLTRNHHGAGFWDGDWPADDGKFLTDMSHAYGSCDLYVGDDGLIYAS